ncbi:MAG: DUF1566 domain-containing protein [Desulfobacterales bacterium]
MLFRTDQIACFDAGGHEIPCDGTGQDGDLRCGDDWPEPRFVVDEAVVVDRLTQLMWSRHAAPETFPATWDEALRTIDRMNRHFWLGYVDWRLPAYRELFSLISHRNINPALPDAHPFEEVFPGYFWTATTCSRLPREAWYVHLGGGRVFKGMKHGSYMLWPVRTDAPSATGSGSADRPVNIPDANPCGRTAPGAGSATRWNEGGDELVRTLTDRANHLTWCWHLKQSTAPVNWDAALDITGRLNRLAAAGCADWHLPNVREAAALVDLQQHSPALPEPFRAIIPAQAGFWTSTSSALDPRYAWVLYAQDGAVGVGYKIKPDFQVLFVRTTDAENNKFQV